MIVSMRMTRNLITIGPDAPIADAATLMAQHRIRRLPVVGQQHDEQRLLGIVSATDILHAYPPRVNPFAVPFKLESLLNAVRMLCAAQHA